jgi:hypothetical protein
MAEHGERPSVPRALEVLDDFMVTWATQRLARDENWIENAFHEGVDQQVVNMFYTPFSDIKVT